MSVKKYQ